MAHSYESHFGPASDPIDVARFIQIATELEKQTPVSRPSPDSVAGFQALDQLPEEYKDSIANECRYVCFYLSKFLSKHIHSFSVTDIKSSIEQVLDNPTLYAHVAKTHDANVYLIHEHADTSGRRKRKRLGVLDPAHEVAIVTALQKTLDSVQLKSWPCVSNSIWPDSNTYGLIGFFLTPHFSCVHLKTQTKMCLPLSKNRYHLIPLRQPPQLHLCRAPRL